MERTKMVNAIPPGISDRPKTAKIKYDFNVDRAKNFEESGYPNGQGLPTLNLIERSFNDRPTVRGFLSRNNLLELEWR